MVKKNTLKSSRESPDLRRKNFYRILSSREKVLKQNHFRDLLFPPAPFPSFLVFLRAKPLASFLKARAA